MSGTEDPVEALILDFIEWLAEAPRDYPATMAAWRTSCPRLPVWEEAVDRGFVERRGESGGFVRVRPSAAGLAHLSARRPARDPDAIGDAGSRRRTNVSGDVSYLVRNLHAVLARRGITIKEAAYYCGVHADSLERLFHGATTKLDLHMLDRLSRAIALRLHDGAERDRVLMEILELWPEQRDVLAALRARLDASGYAAGGGAYGEPVRPPPAVPAEGTYGRQ